MNENHVAALKRNYLTAYPTASNQLASDYATERYLDETERLAHMSQADVDRLYAMVYNVARTL